MSWSVTVCPLLLAICIACVVFEPYNERAANISATVLLNLIAAAAITAILDIYEYSEA